MVDVRFARRRAILSCTIVRNIAFYHADWVTGNGHGRLKDDSVVGRTINSNFMDVAVLARSKLFVDWQAANRDECGSAYCLSPGATERRRTRCARLGQLQRRSKILPLKSTVE
jgi:hypothetical protein